VSKGRMESGAASGILIARVRKAMEGLSEEARRRVIKSAGKGSEAELEFLTIQEAYYIIGAAANVRGD